MKKFFKKIVNWIKCLLFNKKIRYTDETSLLEWNPACPDCGTSMGYFDNGVVVVEYDWWTGGIRTHLSGHGSQEYQFHYYKCQKGCPNGFKMYEYRETPSWWDDLWNLDCPFTQGDIIKKWQNNEFPTKKYTSHRIIR